MAAQRDLDRRREPAQVVVGDAVGPRGQEGGLGDVVLGRDRLAYVASSSAVSRIITAAGLPVNGRSANASIWWNWMRMADFRRLVAPL